VVGAVEKILSIGEEMQTNQTIKLNDLALTEGQEEAVKGGNETIELLDLEPIDEVKGGVSHTAGRCSCGQEHPYGGGGFINNHNETIAADEDEATERYAPLADLPVAEAEHIKGGPHCSCDMCARPLGGFINNHNETIASDEDTPLADLEPNTEVVGGASSGFGYAVLTVGGTATVYQGGQHSAGINVCMMDGSVR
jgi:prepilin-type processing-associated H-X9-DG protein